MLKTLQRLLKKKVNVSEGPSPEDHTVLVSDSDSVMVGEHGGILKLLQEKRNGKKIFSTLHLVAKYGIKISFYAIFNYFK